MIFLLKAKHHLPFFDKPSPGQLAAGNYRKGHRKFQGLDITIENPRGSHRTGKKPDGTDWVTSMAHDYGYIKGTLGVDGDHFDCFVGPQADATHAYIVTTKQPPHFKAEDEQKAMLGFPHEDAARAAFLEHYDDPRFCGAIRAMTMDEFRRQVRTTRKNPRMLKSKILFFKAAHAHDKLSPSMRSEIGTAGSRTRQDEPEGVFLDPSQRKYPVKVKGPGGWHYSGKLLEAAASEARMHGHSDIAARADQIRAHLKE